MFNIGTQEMVLILLVVLLLFGAKRIPEISRAMGKGLADFRDAMAGVERELKGEPPPRPHPTRPVPPGVARIGAAGGPAPPRDANAGPSPGASDPSKVGVETGPAVPSGSDGPGQETLPDPREGARPSSPASSGDLAG